MKRALMVAVAGLVGPMVGASAQSAAPGFGVEAAPFYATADGEDFTGIDAGLGFDLQGRLMWPAWSVGFGWLRSSHDVITISDNLIVSSFFLEPRYQFSTPGAARPYVLARGGWAKQRLDVDDPSIGTLVAEASGWMVGAGGGMAFAVARSIDLNVSAMWVRFSFGDAEVDGQTMADSDTKGSSVLLRFGLSYAFGRR